MALLTWVREAMQRWRPVPTGPQPVRYADDLIDHLDVWVTAFCPCGSKHIHHLTLVSTSDCARCGRTMAIREIQYLRKTFDDLPAPVVSVGYVFTPESLRQRPTHGVQ